MSELLNFLADNSLNVPLGQVLLFVLLIAICFFLGRHKLGLLISYAFVFYWGFIFNRAYFVDVLGETTFGLYIYVFCGLVTAVMVFIGFWLRD
ncbi:MAG: hypothetical protein ACE5GQ_00110 [Nitrospinales bacterium]